MGQKRLQQQHASLEQVIPLHNVLVQVIHKIESAETAVLSNTNIDHVSHVADLYDGHVGALDKLDIANLWIRNANVIIPVIAVSATAHRIPHHLQTLLLQHLPDSLFYVAFIAATAFAILICSVLCNSIALITVDDLTATMLAAWPRRRLICWILMRIIIIIYDFILGSVNILWRILATLFSDAIRNLNILIFGEFELLGHNIMMPATTRIIINVHLVRKILANLLVLLQK